MIPLIPQDKANHFVYGAVIALLVGLIAQQLKLPVAYGVVAAMLVGAVKESLDYYQNWRAKRAGLPPPHGVEFADFVATALGGWAVIILALLH